MEVSYNRLWHLLIDKGIKKTKLARDVNMSYSTLAKLTNNQPVRKDVLKKICDELNCSIDDIAEFKQ
ncbi:MAG: helix-turn-helix transcriptional regulator [Lachnospiraceae bacterium]|nr:helix-turn-helix transcriptional regulator [Lachnospiraceae bacterium]